MFLTRALLRAERRRVGVVDGLVLADPFRLGFLVGLAIQRSSSLSVRMSYRA